MRRVLVGLLLVTAAVWSVPASPAAADGGCPDGQQAQAVPGHGYICVAVSSPGQPDSTSPGSTTHTTGAAVCLSDGKPVPCVTGLGVWFSSHQCYAQPMQPQPTDGSPAWQGHSPEQGQVWVCSSYDGPDTNGSWFFVQNGSTPALVDPGELAANAVDQLPLETPAPFLAPMPPNETYVGLDTWLWIDGRQWHDLELTVAAGGTSVTVRAHPVRATWDLSEAVRACDSAGTPWTGAEGSRTKCFYTFETTSAGEQAGTYPVEVTITYDVTWTCSGACLEAEGDLGEVDGLPGRSAIAVGERQSVVTLGEEVAS